MPSPASTARQRGMSRWWLLVAALTALSYGFTSLVVIVNALGNATGAVWLPSFPQSYYLFSRWLYWPFQWYFALLAPLRAHPGKLHDVCPDKLRAVPDRVCGSTRGHDPQAAPPSRLLLALVG